LLPLVVIVFLILAIVLPSAVIKARRTSPGIGRVLAVVTAVVCGIAMVALVGLVILAFAINSAWSSG
jgi:hypothetical protein